MMAILALLGATTIAACLPITHDHILGRDLATAVPALRSLPAEGDFGLAPLPGKTRLFSLSELKRIAAQSHVDSQPEADVCFNWPVKPIPVSALTDALKRSLGLRQVDIEIIDQSSWPAPDGETIFPLSAAAFSPSGIAFWHGYVRYSQSRRFDIWVRARITVHENHIFAGEKIAADDNVRLAALKVEKYDGPLTREDPVTIVSEFAGKVAKFDIAEGTLLTRNLVKAPKIVERGQTLSVVAAVGRARVEAQCIAEESGNIGSTIAVHNARTGRHLRVLVDSRTTATIVNGDAVGLNASSALAGQGGAN